MMKKFYYNSRPLSFAVFSFLFYQMIYRPPFNSEDFTTSCLVFAAIMAWTAIITYKDQKNSRGLLIFYLITSVLIPTIGIMFTGVLPLQPVWHPFLLGLLLFSVPCLIYWISAASRRRRSC